MKEISAIFAGAAAPTWLFALAGSGRRRGALGHLWCEPFRSDGIDIRERRRERRAAPRDRSVE